jgi:putative Holliday junction resolvase
MPEPGADAMPAAGRVGTLPAPESSSAPEEVALGFDYGTRRIGVAIGNTVSATARPLIVITAGDRHTWGAIATLIDRWKPGVLVVGIARYSDGTAHAMTDRCERFARRLRGRFGLPVARVDERYSSAAAGGANARDDEAAAVILRQWLDERLR